MTQYTLYANRNKATRQDFPYFVDVQHNVLSHLSSRVVIPLARLVQLSQIPKRLCPTVQHEKETFALLTYQMSAVPMSQLAHPCGDLNHMRYQIIAAIDFMVTGI